MLGGTKYRRVVEFILSLSLSPKVMYTLTTQRNRIANTRLTLCMYTLSLNLWINTHFVHQMYVASVTKNFTKFLTIFNVNLGIKFTPIIRRNQQNRLKFLICLSDKYHCLPSYGTLALYIKGIVTSKKKIIKSLKCLLIFRSIPRMSFSNAHDWSSYHSSLHLMETEGIIFLRLFKLLVPYKTLINFSFKLRII